MESESQAFLERFHDATAKLEEDLAEMDARFTKELENMYANLMELERVLERTMSSAARAESMTDHSNTLLGDTQSMLVELSRRMAKMEEERLPTLTEKVDELLVDNDGDCCG
jgi:protein subunit release factor A